jgi:NADPH:quinone reductase-like Zn-dependent oxidoreductase
MRAITVNEYGAPPALTEVPDPQPGPGQVLIRVEAAGMNPMDRVIAVTSPDRPRARTSQHAIPAPRSASRLTR